MDWLHLLVLTIVPILIFLLLDAKIKQLNLKATVKQQDIALRKYKHWHKTWQMASPAEAARLKSPLIRHQSYRQAEYNKFGWDVAKGTGGAVVAIIDTEDYADGIVEPQQYLDRELEWNKNPLK